MTRRIHLLTGTRAEYDLLQPVAAALRAHSVDVKLIPAAAHHGDALAQIAADGIPVAPAIVSLLRGDSWEARGLSFAMLCEGLTRQFAAERPDVLVVAGDREEALAGAIAGNFHGVVVAHLFGGDRCLASDVDEVFRPAISKLSHLHFTATEGHRARLIRMGEEPAVVFAVGATGLDRLVAEPALPDDAIERAVGIDPARPYFLLLHHPSPLLGEDTGAREVEQIVSGLAALGHPILCGRPNTDPGSALLSAALERARVRHPELRLVPNLPRTLFANLYRRCTAIVGNSSSIVIESSVLRVTGILVGRRQELRETGANVLSVPADALAVREAATRALSDPAWRAALAGCGSPYGDGRSGARVAAVLSRVELAPGLRMKTLSY